MLGHKTRKSVRLVIPSIGRQHGQLRCRGVEAMHESRSRWLKRRPRAGFQHNAAMNARSVALPAQLWFEQEQFRTVTIQKIDVIQRVRSGEKIFKFKKTSAVRILSSFVLSEACIRFARSSTSRMNAGLSSASLNQSISICVFLWKSSLDDYF
jgi:hypothetical protein